MVPAIKQQFLYPFFELELIDSEKKGYDAQPL